MEKRYLTVEDAAAYLGISVTGIRGRIRRRTIPFSRLGRSVRLDKAALDRWVQRETVDGTREPGGSARPKA